MKRDESMKISMRHLGLIPVMEGGRKLDDFDQRISGIRDIIREGIEIDTLIDIIGGATPLEKSGPRVFIPRPIAEKPVIGVTLDEAFNFYYRDNLDLLGMAGAKLAANEEMRDYIKGMSGSGFPIFAE